MIPQAAVSVRRFLILGIAAIAAAVTGVAAQAGDPTDDATAGATVTISPSVIVLDNPIARGGHSRRQQIKLSVTVTDRHGRAVLPSRRRPILLDIYQPRGGPLRPGAARITSAEDPSAVFTYDGGYFANSMILTATMGDAGASTSIVPRNRFDPDDCPPGAGHVALRYRDPMRTLEHGFKIDVSVGGGRWHTGVELDTGSTGLVLDRRSIGPEAIGPGKPGTREYYPSGYKIVGNYWLTPVTIGISDPDWGPKAVARTVPIEVFGIDRVECGSNVKTCVPPADQQKAIASFSLMGIGFDRGGAPRRTIRSCSSKTSSTAGCGRVTSSLPIGSISGSMPPTRRKSSITSRSRRATTRPAAGREQMAASAFLPRRQSSAARCCSIPGSTR